MELHHPLFNNLELARGCSPEQEQGPRFARVQVLQAPTRMGVWNEIEEGEAWLRLSVTYWNLGLQDPEKAEVCGEGLCVQQRIRKHTDKGKSLSVVKNRRRVEWKMEKGDPQSLPQGFSGAVNHRRSRNQPSSFSFRY